MKILVGCNLLTSVNSIAYSSHMQMWHHLGKAHKDDTFIFFTPRRMSIDRMRNEAAKLALEYDCDYLFFYDDDVLLPKDSLDLLIRSDATIAAGVTCIRSYPFKPMAFKYVQTGNIYTMVGMEFEEIEEKSNANGLVECDAVGFSCCLIDVKKTLKHLQPPFFVTGPENTEDVYFCHKCKAELEGDLEPYIVLNTKVTTGHILDQYFISEGNRPYLMRLEESLTTKYPSIRGDRDEDYRESVLENLRRAQASM